MSNLEPNPSWGGDFRDRRSQLEAFLKSGVPESDEVVAAVDVMNSEYWGFIRGIADAAAEAESYSYDADEVREGIERIARFAVWRAFIDRETRIDDDGVEAMK